MMGGNGTEPPQQLQPLGNSRSFNCGVAIGIIGFGFYMVYPEIRNTKKTCEPSQKRTYFGNSETSATDVPVSNAAPNSCEVILKTMTPEEQKVLNCIDCSSRKVPAKVCGKEAGLSRLKTHRIVARFAERGIVTVKPLGNTNEVTVSEWVSKPKPQSSSKLFQRPLKTVSRLFQPTSIPIAAIDVL